MAMVLAGLWDDAGQGRGGWVADGQGRDVTKGVADVNFIVFPRTGGGSYKGEGAGWGGSPSRGWDK